MRGLDIRRYATRRGLPPRPLVAAPRRCSRRSANPEPRGIPPTHVLTEPSTRRGWPGRARSKESCRGCGAKIILAAVLFAPLAGIAAAPTAAATCASLAGLTLPDTTITAAQPIPAGSYTVPDGEVFPNMPAFCRIAATLTPTSDSDINIEVWMPFSGWNGRYLGTGNGGVGGLTAYSTMAAFLPANYAVANTDLGTSPAATQGSKVVTGHPEKQIDFATRSTNLMTVRSKQIIEPKSGSSGR